MVLTKHLSTYKTMASPGCRGGKSFHFGGMLWCATRQHQEHSKHPSNELHASHQALTLLDEEVYQMRITVLQN